MKLSKKLLVSGLSLALGLVGLGTLTNMPANASSTRYALTTKATRGLPKNTRVAVNYTTKKSGKSYASIDASRLNYKLKKAVGNKKAIALLSDNLKTVKARVEDQIPTLFKGAEYTSSEAASKVNQLKVTTDGYVELYSNSASTTPISSTKVTATRKSGQITYLYSKTNMAKLPDRHIHKTGNYRYRLAIRDNQKSSSLSRSYSVGTLKNLFFKPTLNA